MDKKDIEECVDYSIDRAISEDYISENSSRKEVETMAYEILELGCDVDAMDVSEYEYAVEYLLENF